MRAMSITCTLAPMEPVHQPPIDQVQSARQRKKEHSKYQPHMEVLPPDEQHDHGEECDRAAQPFFLKGQDQPDECEHQAEE